MAVGEGIALRPRFPSRSLGNIGGYAIVAGIVVVGTYLIFGSERTTLPGGEVNLLGYVPSVVLTAALLGLLLAFLPSLRKPALAADRYALRVRPGCLRTVVLPWIDVLEVVGSPVVTGTRTQAYLLVCRDSVPSRRNARPRWWDRTVLREAVRRGGPGYRRYDLAVRMDDFDEPPLAQLAMLARLAPGHVRVIDELENTFPR